MNEGAAHLPSDDRDRPAGRRRRFLLGAVGLVVILAIALALRLIFFAGCVGSDDVTSWQVAHHLSRGVVWPENPQTSVPLVRHGLILPAAGLFAIFGSDESTAMVYPILASLLGIAAVWDIARRLTGSPWAAHLAGGMAALASIDVVNSSMFLPDVPMTAMTAISLWCLLVGYRAKGRIGPGRCVALLFAGALVAFAGMHKVVGYAAIVALGIWALSLIVSRKWRWELLWVPAGFLIVLIAEHAMFWGLYGDPFVRWKTITAGLDKYAAAMERGGRDVLNSERIGWWIGQIAREFPSFAMVMLVSCLLALLGLALWWRDVRVRLFCLTMVSMVILRFWEFTRTYSYQPRRLLPFVMGAAVLSAFALRRLRWRRVAVAAGAAFLIAQSVVLFAADAGKMRRYADQLGPERWLSKWSRRNEALVGENGLYVDHRTFSAVEVMSGRRDLDALGFRLYTKTALNAPIGDRSVEPEPEYADGSFFFENARTLKAGQTHLPYRREVYGGLFSGIPPAWRLLAIAESRTTPSWSCALYRVHADPAPEAGAENRIVLDFSGTHDPKKDLLYGWYVKGARGQKQAPPATRPVRARSRFGWERIDTADGAGRLAIRLEEGKAVSLVSGAANVSTVPPKRLHCKAGRPLVARVTVHRREARVERDWANAKIWVLAYDKDGRRHTLFADVRRLYYDRHELRAYVVAPFDVYGLRMLVQFLDPGRYEFEPVTVDLYERLPYGP